MSLAQKLFLFAFAAALVPLSVTGFSLIEQSETTLKHRIAEHQQSAAVAIAANVAVEIEDLARRAATLLSMVQEQQLNAEEKRGLLLLLLRQSERISLGLWVDEDGSVAAGPLRAPDVEGKQQASTATTTSLLEKLPQPTGERSSILISPPYFVDGVAKLAMALPCCSPDGDGRQRVALEVAITADLLEVQGLMLGEATRILLIDRAAVAVAGSNVPATLRPGTALSQHPSVAQLAQVGEANWAEIGRGSEAIVAAYGPVGALGWGVVVEQPAALAFAVARQMRSRVLLAVSLTALGTLLGVLWFAGRLRRALTDMTAGAQAFASGRLNHRIDHASKRADELGQLATTMNAMAGQLAQSHDELEAWNRTLEERVAARTDELRKAQSELLTQSKLAAIGQLGAGVAHEVNNPLAGVLGYTQILLRKLGPEHPQHEMLLKIEAAARRCKEVTVNLLRFSEWGLSGFRKVDISELTRQSVTLLRSRFEAANVRIALAADTPLAVVADPGQLTVLLLNLLSNARNAMPDGGTLSITTAADGADGALIRVSDTGIGIEQQHLSRIFEPFFTTKTVWTGVGLGLSVAYRIATNHGGTIDVSSSPGQGATFTVRLPSVPPEEALADASEPQGRQSFLE